MVLLNRKLKNKDVDQFLLFEKFEKVVVDFDEEEEESDEIFVYYGIILWVFDVVIMIIQYIQIFVLILIMGECWGFLGDFVRGVVFIFFFNFDIWEFIKVVVFKVYIGFFNLNIFIELDRVGIDYSNYLIGWMICIVFIGCGFLIIYGVFLYRKLVYLLFYVVRMKCVFSVII